jgi:small conductance mechanosensitive channel
MEEQAHELMTSIGGLMPLIVSNALSALGALVILLVGLWFAGRADAFAVRMLGRTPQLDPMLKSFFGNLVRYLILIVTVLAVLSQFGIQTTSLVAVLGAASLAVGLALQGTLSNLAAGVMLLIFRPFRIGQKLQVGANLGTVKQLSLFWTELVTDDQIQIIVPNAGVWGQPLRNYSIYPAPPFTGEAHVRIGEETELQPTLDRVRALVEAQPRVLADPPPKIFLERSAAENALELVVAFSTAKDEVRDVKSDLIKAMHDALPVALGGHAEGDRRWAAAQPQVLDGQRPG